MREKVAFIGKMFSGKTTAAKFLAHEYGFVKLAFADPVKIVAAEMLAGLNSYLEVYNIGEYQKWTYEEIQRRKGEPQVRKLLQLVGTELGRELYDEDVWVKILLKEAENLPRVVVDDCRFPNEASALKENGFKIIQVVRPEEDRVRMLKEKYPDTWESIVQHPSETSLDNYRPDAILYAETVDQLHSHTNAMIQTIDLLPVAY